jgi:predicted transcriptional regulator
MSMTLRLDPGTDERLRVAAFELRTTKTAIVEEAVRRELARLEAEEDAR